MTRSEDRFWGILFYIFIAVVCAGALLHHCAFTLDCEQKHCERGAPIVIRDSGAVGYQCVCMERPK